MPMVARNASATSCAGEMADISLVADYHFTKRFDAYAGVNWSTGAERSGQRIPVHL